MAKPAQEAEMANTVTFHTWLVCAHVNRFERCEEQDGERWCQQSDECANPHLVLCGPSLTLSPWTTAESKLSPDEDTA